RLFHALVGLGEEVFRWAGNQAAREADGDQRRQQSCPESRHASLLVPLAPPKVTIRVSLATKRYLISFSCPSAKSRFFWSLSDISLMPSVRRITSSWCSFARLLSPAASQFNPAWL